MSAVLVAPALASARIEVSEYLSALFLVYTVVIFAYILVSLVQSAGIRIPYTAFTGALFRFLNDAVEPFLAFFRRFIPPIGPFDVSAIVAIFTVQIIGRIVVALVHG